ncbi:Glutathione transport system permease protein GsiD [Corynebacterium glaucum]|uniref:Glutathione transport system permease protein GsiD n=1 Tax=Corynebacterium glaucum TaxID=187491 RepID=A0A1Q2HX83_9CORY|nr:ABC transporter permease [Corynebacterium glaucum]AQQ15443.1 Glutathione transport system permease protein GsiD [Corynebacterium glaucum]WJZ07943.1 Glutathione transport system permease protein GsiD [Corynebacterium glaucum]
MNYQTVAGRLAELIRNPAGLFGLVVVAIILLGFAVSFIWVPYDPAAVNPSATWAPPSGDHWLGTDQLGRDIFSMMLVGTRVTVLTSLGGALIALIAGLLLTFLITYAPRWLSQLTERITDIWVAFPTLIIALILATAFQGSAVTSAVAIGLGSAPSVTRTILPEVRRVSVSDYVLLATAAGARGPWLLHHHIFPNVAPTLIVRTTQIMGTAALAEAGLSYLGVGTPPPTPSWGRMLSTYQSFMYSHPSVILIPATAIVVTIIGFNLLGDGLRDVYDPRKAKA